MFRLNGEEMDLQMLARLFCKGPMRVEKHEELFYLHLEDEDKNVPTSEDVVLAWMNAILLADNPNFRPASIAGITKKDANGRLLTILSPSCHIQARATVLADLTVLRDGKVLENKGPTWGEIELKFAANNEPLARAFLIYGTLEHDWGNLYKVVEAIEDGNGGERALIAKKFVADGQIKDFKNTANSFLALGLESRHGSTAKGSPTPKMTLDKAKELTRTLLQAWIEELRGDLSDV
jgi:hypothetical protein